MSVTTHARRDGRPIGQVLLDDGTINENQLLKALASQARSGGPLGRHLLLQGSLTRLELYGTLAKQWGAPFVDMLKNPPDSELLAEADPEILLQDEWIPYRKNGDLLIIATSVPPTDRMIETAKQSYKVSEVRFIVTTDWDIDQVVTGFCRNRLLFNAAEELAYSHPDQSAKSGLARWQRWSVIGVGVLLLAGVIWSLPKTLVAILAVANLLFMVAVGFKIITTIAGAFKRHDDNMVIKAVDKATVGVPKDEMADVDLPMYTILVPAFHEANVIELIIEHMGQLDWPKSKMQVLVLTEEVDKETIEAVKRAQPPEYVRLLIVPDGSPRTKPRACNFGLMFAQGEYLVIYDAEDRPDPDQLRKVHRQFQIMEHETDRKIPVVCLQAALNYFNTRQNLLTRMFTLEYSSWFDGMLPGMDFFRLPIPLGGTSNHFKTDLLRQLGGWDPYNVTEDADLGMRASSAGFTVGTIDSTTWEEACSKIPAWIRQRTRWIKGYMVTALVDLRHPVKFTRSAGKRSLATLLGLIAGTPLMFLAYPLVWGLTILTYIGVAFAAFQMPPWLETAAVWNAIVGNVSVILIGVWAGWRRQGWRLGVFAVFFPLYWGLHAWAAWRALFQMIRTPFEWEKTPHGLQHDRVEAAEVT